jgi:hypothetical protein
LQPLKRIKVVSKSVDEKKKKNTTPMATIGNNTTLVGSPMDWGSPLPGDEFPSLDMMTDDVFKQDQNEVNEAKQPIDVVMSQITALEASVSLFQQHGYSDSMVSSLRCQIQTMKSFLSMLEQLPQQEIQLQEQEDEQQTDIPLENMVNDENVEDISPYTTTFDNWELVRSRLFADFLGTMSKEWMSLIPYFDNVDGLIEIWLRTLILFGYTESASIVEIVKKL